MFTKFQVNLFILLLGFQLGASSSTSHGLNSNREPLENEYQVNDECTISKKIKTVKGERSKCSVFETRYEVSGGYDIYARFGGKYTPEVFGAARMFSFNDNILNDRQFYARSTADFFIDFSYGIGDFSRIQFHDTLRFRHNWGNSSDVSTDSISIDVAGVTETSSGTTLKKHVSWTREAWLKIMLGTLETRDDFIQVGLIPYSVGRGIALGSAYSSSGFLGFSPGFSIDQYAPGVTLRYDLYPKHLFLEGYFALLENKHTSYKSNSETIRSSEILENGASEKRGTSSFVYLLAFRSKIVPLEKGDNKKLTIEPYFVYQQAPDQKVEFENDSASFLKSFGVAAEFVWNRFKCGGEFGMNRGNQEIKPWDRNGVSIVSDDGSIIQQYTKIYSDAGLTTLAKVTTANAEKVANAERTIDKNGLEISTSAALYNAVDRLRPRQKKQFEGWFALFDASYDILPKNLTFVFGAGWASGELTENTNVNDLNEQALMNQIHSGFVPLQSVYSGTKLRQIVMLSGGVPRFAKKQPWESSTNQNIVTSANGKDTLNGFTNISFIGGNLEWSVLSFEKHKLQISPNVTHYWSPESPLLEDGTAASASLGTELLLEVSAKIFDRIKLYSYGGVFFPGKQYTQMKEAGVVANKVAIGDSPAYIINIGATFAF